MRFSLRQQLSLSIHVPVPASRAPVSSLISGFGT
mgnify:CR=1 FL=1